ncbi:MAG: transglycosylase SLT domain-containing protein [Bryobacteraceae bacterium]
MAFLPASPHVHAAEPEVAPPPPVEPNQYLSSIPVSLHTVTPPPATPSRADELMQRAEQRFQRGRRLYQSEDAARARQEFDSAIDLMLEAGSEPLGDRAAWERKLESMVDAIHRYDLAGLGASADPDDQRYEKAPLEDILEMTFPVDPKLKSRVREQAHAISSQLPLSINDAVLGYVHYFSSRGHKTLVSGLERAGRYRPMIQRILDEEGVPQEMIYLAQAESGFMPRALSRKAAAGMWQFMAFRGRQYGLMQTPYSDDRLDPEKSTRAAAKHLRDLYTQFGDWYLAIAAYNCGPGVVESAVERTGYADFWELRERRVLPAETTNYVPIILAMTIMAKNPGDYGLDAVSPDTPLEYDSVEMSATTHLQLVADLLELPVSELMQLNPALLKPAAPAGYSLRVPRGAGPALRASIERVPEHRRAAWRVHKVVNGDTLAGIGRRYRVTAASISAANPSMAALTDGALLLIPTAAASQSRTVRRASTRGTSARNVSSSRRGGAARKTSAAASARKPAVPSAASKSARKTQASLSRAASSGHRSAPASN